MNKAFINISLSAAVAFGCLQASAIPAKQGVMSVSTADGTELKVRIAGDEFFHQYFTEDGYPLIEKNGNFYYADYKANGDVIDSGIKAVAVADRGASAKAFLSTVDKEGMESRIRARATEVLKSVPMAQTRNNAPVKAADGNDGPPYERGYGLFPDLRFPAYGAQKAIVILVEYTDVKFNTSYNAKDYFTRMLNEDGFADYGGTGSAGEYFRENSDNAFRPEFDVYGPITLSNNMAYYGGNDWWGNDQRPEEMVIEACQQLDDQVNFADYDRNGDGVVDNIFIFYAGRGEASGGSANTVWPHSWNMTSAGYPNLKFDGVRIHTYGCSNEWENGRPDGIGTFVHEFSHVMGLPDLYATSYTSAFTPGSWSALDYGPYNNDGMTPPNYGAFERYALGWMKPLEITGALSATLPAISTNRAGVIRTAKDTEFFLLENRQKEGWDAYIPGHGMLVWHVDYNSSVWSQNTVNNTVAHQYVDIEEADGSQNEYSRDGDAFPGVSNKTTFTGHTTPAMKTWTGTVIDLPLTNIAENGGVITFDVLGGATPPVIPPVEVLPAEDVESDSFVARWVKEDEMDYLLSVYYYSEMPTNAPAYQNGSDGKIYLSGFNARNVGAVDSYSVSGLEAERQYFYTVTPTTGWHIGEPSEEIPVITGRLGIEYYNVIAEEAAEVTSTGFIANWQELDQATEYLLTVYTKDPSGTNIDNCDFTGGIDAMTGWISTSSMTYGMENYCGEATPSLRLANGNTLTSPVYEDQIKSVSFWHRGNNTSTGDVINLYANTSDGQQLVASFDVNKEIGGTVNEVSEMPGNTVQITIEFKRTGSQGSLALDDVKVGHGEKWVELPLDNYNDLNVGSSLSRVVDGLQQETDYYYTVRATDGEKFSKPSQEIYVHTPKGTGVDSVSATSLFTVNVDGMLLTAATGDEIIVCDYTGALVAKGAYKVVLPRAGLYLISVPAQGYVAKIIVR